MTYGPAAHILRTEEVVHRKVAGEVFLVPIRGRLADLRELFVLNEVGSWVWERLDGSRTPDDLVAEMVREFEVAPQQATADIDSFLHQLGEAGLVEAAVDQGD